METLLITQARMSSTRLPEKVMMKINNETLLQIHLNRLKNSKKVDKIVVATTIYESDTIIYNSVKNWGFDSYRGSEEDVLDRYYQAAKNYNPKWVVRVTSDCPLIDSNLLDQVINRAQKNDTDYTANILIENFPDGQDIEVFKFSALEKAWKEAVKKSDREHVTLYIRNNCDFNGGSLFKALNFPCEFNFSKIRMTVDEQRDFELIKKLIESLGTDKTWLEYTNYIIENNLSQINDSIIRNEGYLKSLKND